MRLIFGLLLAVFLFAGDVRVAASANVMFALKEIVKNFQKLYPNIKIRVTVASSGKLAAQIENGADYDIFLSANKEYPKRLFDKNLTYTKPVVYAKGAIVLASKKSGLDILKAKRVAVANPKTAPYGKAAMEFLKNKGLYQKIKDRLIFGESVAQTLIYTLKAADIGIIAKSAVCSPNLKNVYWVDIPKKFYKPINQAMVLIKNKKDAKEFFVYILSKESYNVFKKYGYN